MTARPIMIQGTMSGAGKSLLCAGLCRVLAQRGLRVAPFKSQNMALNSGVTADGLEMGRAQVVQAQTAGVEPDVRMNPILLKPTSDIGSQVIVRGEVWRTLSAREYYAVKSSLIPIVREAYESLAAENDVIVIEGAGSPAEINLPGDGFVNMGLARLVSAPVLLVGDIDRGGVFAQLYGTVALLLPEDRARVRGLVINKFRGDESILRPGLRQLEELCGAPVAGVVPYTVLDIDDEDSLAPRLRTGAVAADEDALTVAVIRLPRISNFTDFAPLEAHPGCSVAYTVDPAEVTRADVAIIPGTKSTLDDLRWLRETGLAEAIVRRAREGATVIGLCGGYQMLGQCLEDTEGVEGAAGESARGLGLLPVRTRFDSGKTRTRVQGVAVAPPWQGAALEGYEIHMGRTTVEGEPFCVIDGRTEGCSQGAVFGTYLHGLFDSGELVEALLADQAQRKGTRYQARPITSRHAQLEESFDRLADTLRRSLDWTLIDGLLEINDE